MAFALKSRGRLAQATLIDSDQALRAIGETARSKLLRALVEHGVRLEENAPVERIEDGYIVLQDGREVLSDFTTGAAGARPYGWLANSGLDLQDGFIRVSETLQSSAANVFAAGDCAHLDFAPRPKAGVYAVRQAPVLYHNLRSTLTGDPLRKYRPQKDYLKLISMLIYKIFRADEWAALQAAGETSGAPIDVADGYVHFSTATQAAETAAKHFAGAEGLTLLACDADAMGDDLKWEVSRGGAEFPHLYRNIRTTDVVWAKPLPLVEGTHQFPEEMA